MRYLIALLLFALPSWAETPCGPGDPCEVDDGSYHLRIPENWDGQTPLPVLIFYHGHNATGEMIFRAGGLKADFVDQGYLLVAPNGEPIAGRKTRRWPGRTGSARDDVAFTLSVLEDVRANFPVAPNKVFVAGFSAGGSMAWLMACQAAEAFDGFASVSGALRRPNPTENCPSAPVRFLQIHGFADAQVPFEGRGIRDWHQGDLFESFNLARAVNRCRTNPDNIEIGDRFWCRSWDNSCGEGALRMCIHDGGHGLPRGWTAMAREWFEGGS